MKKLFIICLALALAGGTAFGGENHDSDDEGELILRGAAGIMYLHSLAGGVDFSIFGFRGGVHGDIMYNMGRFEFGAEAGVYAMEIEYWYGPYYGLYFFALDVPINALVRMNFDRKRFFALEARGGIWLSFEIGDVIISDIDANVGGRLVVGPVYIGADYLFGLGEYYPHLAIEAGVKIAFE